MVDIFGKRKKEDEAESGAAAPETDAPASGSETAVPPSTPAEPQRQVSPMMRKPAVPVKKPNAIRPEIPRRGMAQSDPNKQRAPAVHGRQLVVGRDISLNGEIKDCERLVVEGSVEAALVGSDLLQIAHGGIFKGPAEVEEAEISGVFEGELTVQGRLVVKTGGRVDGSVRYGEIEIQPGGVVTGTLELLKS